MQWDQFYKLLKSKPKKKRSKNEWKLEKEKGGKKLSLNK